MPSVRDCGILSGTTNSFNGRTSRLLGNSVCFLSQTPILLVPWLLTAPVQLTFYFLPLFTLGSVMVSAQCRDQSYKSPFKRVHWLLTRFTMHHLHITKTGLLKASIPSLSYRRLRLTRTELKLLSYSKTEPPRGPHIRSVIVQL